MDVSSRYTFFSVNGLIDTLIYHVHLFWENHYIIYFKNCIANYCCILIFCIPACMRDVYILSSFSLFLHLLQIKKTPEMSILNFNMANQDGLYRTAHILPINQSLLDA